MRPTFLALLLCSISGTAGAETLVALRAADLHLISFDSAAPGTLTGDLTLTGFPTGVVPAALDFRPETQTLVILARGPVSTDCRMYAVNSASGAASAQGAAFTCPADLTDIDFNPVSDRLRGLSTSENFKVSADGLKEPNADPDFVVGDANAGDTPMMAGSAYDQNIADAAATTLFAIEAGNNVLVRVGSINGSPNSPDTGELTTIGELDLGLAVLDVDADAVCDISPVSPGTAYLFSFAPAQNTFNGNLYTVNLTTGAANHIAAVGAGGVDLLGLTAAPGITLGESEEEDDVLFGGACALLPLLIVGALARRRRGSPA